jgi:hypothetical protein
MMAWIYWNRVRANQQGNLNMSAPFVDLSIHHAPRGLSDRIAYGFTRTLRFCADTFFAKRYGHRSIVLEPVAADRKSVV